MHITNVSLHLNGHFLQGIQSSRLLTSILFQTHMNEGENIRYMILASVTKNADQ